MLVTDLHHFLDLPEDVPGPAHRLARQLADIIRAATAGDAGTPWRSALVCRRRPAHRTCPGRIIVLRPEPPDSIRWQCSDCDDQGVISNWAGSPADLRRHRLDLAPDGAVHLIPDRAAATLRELRLPDAETERLVFSMRAHDEGAALRATVEDLDVLIGFVATVANQEPDRRRRQRLKDAMAALEDAARTADGA